MPAKLALMKRMLTTRVDSAPCLCIPSSSFPAELSQGRVITSTWQKKGFQLVSWKSRSRRRLGSSDQDICKINL